MAENKSETVWRYFFGFFKQSLILSDYNSNPNLLQLVIYINCSIRFIPKKDDPEYNTAREAEGKQKIELIGAVDIR